MLPLAEVNVNRFSALTISPKASPTTIPIDVYLPSVGKQQLSDVAPSTGVEALEVLTSLQHVGTEQMMQMLDALASCEQAMGDLVTDAQRRIAAMRAEKAAERAERAAAAAAKALRRSSKVDRSQSASPTNESECSSTQDSPLISACVPFWADASGALRLVRVGPHLKSNEVGRLELGARVAVLEKRQSGDGAWRAAIALEGTGDKVHGWMTLITKDGVDNVTYIDPQPAIPLPPPLEPPPEPRGTPRGSVAHC